MKTTNLIEGIKANKGKIIKRGLILIGAAAGLILTYGLLKGPTEEDDFNPEFDDIGNEDTNVVQFEEGK